MGADFVVFFLVGLFVFHSLVLEFLMPVLIRLYENGGLLVARDILLDQRFAHNRNNSVLRHAGGVFDTLMFGNLFSEH